MYPDFFHYAAAFAVKFTFRNSKLQIRNLLILFYNTSNSIYDSNIPHFYSSFYLKARVKRFFKCDNELPYCLSILSLFLASALDLYAS